MIRVVLDTNIFISALFWKGAPYKIVQKGLGGAFTILTSLPILEEVEDRLINKFKFPQPDAHNLLGTITINSQIIEISKRVRVVNADPHDDKIVECAVSGQADFIVTGDKHLLDIKNYQNISIVASNHFLKIL